MVYELYIFTQGCEHYNTLSFYSPIFVSPLSFLLGLLGFHIIIMPQFHSCQKISKSTHYLAPSGSPMWLNATDITSTTITIQWGAVPCMDRNSEITGYKVRYGPVGSSQRATDAVTGRASTGGMYTLTGLIPSTNYFIHVAAINRIGDTGPYTLPVVASTVQIESCKLNCLVASL